VRAAISNLPPPYTIMYAMMHLRNFCQVSIEDVMTRSAVKSSAPDKNNEGRRLKIEDN